MKFDTEELFTALESGNWQLHIHTSANEFYIEVVDSQKCDTLLQKAMLSQSGQVWHGNLALFYSLPKDADVLGLLIFRLYQRYRDEYGKYIHWKV